MKLLVKSNPNNTITINEAIRDYNLNNFLIINYTSKYRLVKFDNHHYKMMTNDTNVIIAGNYFGSLDEVLEELIDVGYKIYIEDKNKCQ